MSRFLAPVSLFLSFSFGVIGLAVGINALVKSNDSKDELRKLTPPDVIVDINTNDVYHSGVVVTVVCGLIALLSLIGLVYDLLFSRRRKSTTTTEGGRRGSLVEKILAALLAFCSVWLFATQIPLTHFIRTRSASVHAYLRGVELPSALIQSIERSTGNTPVYHKLNYLRLLAALPWFAFLFGLTSSILLFLASRRRHAVGSTHHATTTTEKPV